MDRINMTEPSCTGVTRPRERPLAGDVLDAMKPGEPYTVGELVARLSEHKPSEGTVRNRLSSLVDDGRVIRKQHSERVVTYRRPVSDGD